MAISLIMVVPVGPLTNIHGIVTKPPLPPGNIPTNASSLLTMIAATAPAFCAFNAFTPNSQVFL